MKEENKSSASIEVILYKLDTLQVEVGNLKRVIDSKYVTQDQFRPVKAIALGLVSIILTSFTVALVALVVKGGG